MTEQLIARLKDLYKQATEENSHYYVGKCVKDSIETIEILTNALEDVTNVLEKQGQDILNKHKGSLLPRYVEQDLIEIATAVGKSKEALSKQLTNL